MIPFSMLPWEDQLRSHPVYAHAAVAASQIYVTLFDTPGLASKANGTAHLTGEEKKAKKKAKKAASKAQEEPKKPTPTSTSEDKGLEPPPAKDEDPDGAKILQAADPLERAWKFLIPLLEWSKDLEVWIAIYDVAVRRKKYLQAIKALNLVKSVDPEHPELHLRLIDLHKTLSSLPQQPPAPIGPAVTEAAAKLVPEDVSLETFNSQYLQRQSTSPKAILASAKAIQRIGTSPIEEIESTVFGILNPDVTLDHKTAFNALSFLKDVKSPRAEEFREACEGRFEMSTVFKTPTDISALRRAAFANLVEDEEAKEKEVQVDEIS